MLRPFLTVVVLSCCAGDARADTIDLGQAICYEAQMQIDAIVTYTKTSCIPSLTKSNALSFIFLSTQPVFAVEASKEAWLIVAVGAVGLAFNSRPGAHGEAIVFTDVNQIKNSVGYSFPIILAKTLQRRVYLGQLSVSDM